MAENEADSAKIDIEGLVSSIKAQMSEDQFMSPNCFIFKTPTVLREINEKAYVPDAFSFGSFHHGRPKYEETKKIKCKYLQAIISKSPCPDEMLRNLTESVMDVEREARECYAGPIGYSPDEFVKTLVIDGCFIIELLRKRACKTLREENDPIFTMACMFQFLLHDLILLENQVPWLVLERLFKMTVNPTYEIPLIELVKFFLSAHYFAEPASEAPILDMKHIVDVARKWLISSIAEEDKQIVWTLLPSATRLIVAGVKIRRGESRSILDMKFDNGVLEIPPLEIDETTEILFQNIISFEQCYPNCQLRFTSYAVLLDNLVNTARDMDVLCKNKIIKNWLNPEDAVPFFNQAVLQCKCQGDLLPEPLQGSEYIASAGGLDGVLCLYVRNYFNTPWAILSTTAAAILLILSFLQTLFTIYKK